MVIGRSIVRVVGSVAKRLLPKSRIVQKVASRIAPPSVVGIARKAVQTTTARASSQLSKLRGGFARTSDMLKTSKMTGSAAQSLSKPSLLSRVGKWGGRAATAGILGYSVYDIGKSILSNKAPSASSVTTAGRQALAGEAALGGAEMGLIPTSLMSRIGGAAALAGGLYGAEQLAERLGVRGGAGFVGSRIYGKRSKPGLINKRAKRILSKAARYEKTLAKYARKLGIGKRKGGGKSSLDMNEIMMARALMK